MEQLDAPAGFTRGDWAPLSPSSIWNSQRRRFAKTGVEAWRGNTAPNYVSANLFCTGAIPFFELSRKRRGRDLLTRQNLACCRQRAVESGRR